ncbi:MAG: hypothetical protein JWN86_3164 [Planctomycetota bacterium]|nr:hypothetical protein [Planctomycetota bacterium]
MDGIGHDPTRFRAPSEEARSEDLRQAEEPAGRSYPDRSECVVRNRKKPRESDEIEDG